MPTIDLANYPVTVAAFGGDEQRALVFLDRYSAKDAEGTPTEDVPAAMWKRVARAIGSSDEQIKRFFNLLFGFKFVPGGRILAGAGVDAEVTYYNCYVIPVETKIRRQLNRMDKPSVVRDAYSTIDPGSDSREAIFDTIGLMVDIMSRGGGVGINWSVLRPRGTHLKRVNGTTSGPIPWMDVASRAVGVVEQGGSRRGAAMFMLDDWHPDVEEFVNAKRDYSLITNANVSVAVSDEFMEAVKRDAGWDLRFPDTSDDRYNTDWDGDLAKWEASGGRVIVHRTINARDLWHSLATAAHASGEPGVVFLGRYNALSTGKGVERIISVNPCGEQGLGAYSVCNLGAMNLAAYVKNPEGEPAYFDWQSLTDDAKDAIEFLDAVIDKTHYFIPENEAIQKKLRRVGLGVMGLADALILLGYRYGSEEAVHFTEAVFSDLKQAALDRSSELATTLGKAPGWNSDMLNSPYLLSGMLDAELRNLFLLTQAPTGTTSILAGVNSGIEPLFDLQYTRKDRTGTHRVDAPVLKRMGYDGSWTADFLVTANDVTVEEHIAMQAAAQKYIDSSVSKTINAPNSQTVEEVEKAFQLAYDSGLKGVAYFRDGSGRDQVLYRDVEPAEVQSVIDAMESPIHEYEDQLSELIPYMIEAERPASLYGTTHKVATKSGAAYVTVNRDSYDRPVEVFVNIGKSGDDVMTLGEALGRLISLALQKGATLGNVSHQLIGVGGSTKIAFQKSVPHAVGEALELEDKTSPENEPDIQAWEDEGGAITPRNLIPVESLPHPIQITDPCPICSSQVAKVEGCKTCYSCGWSAC